MPPPETSAPAGGPIPRIEADGIRASLSLGPAYGSASRDLAATVTIRLHNGSKLPVRVAWLDAQNNATFDPGIGRLLKASADGPFAGMPNCTYSNADQCRPTGGTELASGESQFVTLSLQTSVPVGDSDRAMNAKRGTFTARLSLYPPESAPVEKTVSVTVKIER